MALRKTNHSKRIISKKSISLKRVEFHDIIEFRYDSKNDKIPLLFILKVEQKIIGGINVNYLKEADIDKLLEESRNISRIGKINQDEVDLNYWTIYKHAYRTYSIKKMKAAKLVHIKGDDLDLAEQLELFEKQQEKQQKNK